jgi:hypothetical protein
MDQRALSNRLAGFSDLFKEGSTFQEELKAMSYVLANMEDKDLKEVCKEDSEEKESSEGDLEVTPKEEEKEVSSSDKEEDTAEKEEKEEEEAEEDSSESEKDSSVGTFWTKQASEAVINFLKREAAQGQSTSKLPADQTPDGSRGNKPASTLKEDQIPKIEESLDSKIVEKSHGKVRKEASDVVEPKKEAPKKEEAPKEEVAEPVKVEATYSYSEGVELTAAMEDAELTASDIQDLSKIF